MDNIFNDCPPKMSDGRAFLDSKTATRRNEQIKYVNNVLRDDDYRRMLQQSAVAIMQRQNAFLSKQCGPRQCVHSEFGTRISADDMAKQMAKYNASRDNPEAAPCEKLEDFKMTEY